MVLCLLFENWHIYVWIILKYFENEFTLVSTIVFWPPLFPDRPPSAPLRAQIEGFENKALRGIF